MAYDPDNLFMRIIRGELPCVKVYEDADVLAFMDIMPQSEGHALVVPKVAGENLLDTPAASVAAAMTVVQRLAQAAPQAFGCPGVMVAQFNGAAAGQTVFHLHFHVIPRWPDRPYGAHAQRKAEPVDLTTQAAKLQTALANLPH
jgi:histidine triad (HIT) family protein